MPVEGGIADETGIAYQSEFRHLDTAGNDLSAVEKVLELPETVQAPVEKGTEAGRARYLLNGTEIGSTPILFTEDVEKAGYPDYLNKIFGFFLL